MVVRISRLSCSILVMRSRRCPRSQSIIFFSLMMRVSKFPLLFCSWVWISCATVRYSEPTRWMSKLLCIVSIQRMFSKCQIILGVMFEGCRRRMSTAEPSVSFRPWWSRWRFACLQYKNMTGNVPLLRVHNECPSSITRFLYSPVENEAHSAWFISVWISLRARCMWNQSPIKHQEASIWQVYTNCAVRLTRHSRRQDISEGRKNKEKTMIFGRKKIFAQYCPWKISGGKFCEWLIIRLDLNRVNAEESNIARVERSTKHSYVVVNQRWEKQHLGVARRGNRQNLKNHKFALAFCAW